MGHYCIMDSEFQFEKKEKVLKMDGDGVLVQQCVYIYSH